MHNIINLIILYSNIYGVDPNLAISIAKVESTMDSTAIGPYGELGIMQLLPESYPKYSTEQLQNNRINIKLAIKTLSKLKDTCKHKYNHSYVICYNKGVNGGNKVKYPEKDRYYKRVMKEYNAINNPNDSI